MTGDAAADADAAAPVAGAAAPSVDLDGGGEYAGQPAATEQTASDRQGSNGAEPGSVARARVDGGWTRR